MSEQEIALIQEKIKDLQHTLKDMSEFAGREGTMSHTSRIPASSEETEVIRWIDQATKDHALSVSHFEKLQRSQMPLENDDATGEIPKRLIWKTQYKLQLVGTYGDWLAFLKQLEEDAPRLFVVTDVDITIYEGKNLLGGSTIFNTDTTVAITLMFDAYDWNETKAR
ncbi:MAG: hypothetical protein BSOLF_1322 [Candidatus Carbobacillus altaicus]|uniref:Uncharacterized protein n=1 Tax=Candidatus Carbonibacillus altaicus TaxID=2163959 RepID=A0A2R6XZL4_9BACL|nr:MAG: hypothetical protein BSOLF_1322 [Candidatus Carbobacillus altaicus]